MVVGAWYRVSSICHISLRASIGLKWSTPYRLDLEFTTTHTILPLYDLQ